MSQPDMDQLEQLLRQQAQFSRPRLVTPGEQSDIDNWSMRIIRDSRGAERACLENIALYLENHPDWQGVLGYNEFSASHVLMKAPPSPIQGRTGDSIEDHFDTELARWFERNGLMVRPDQVRLVVDSIARANTFHPVRDYLNSLPAWDGLRRINTWLLDYCGVESSDSSPNLYAMAVGSKFLISAVARIMRPGCKADCMLLLEGKQGRGKSTAVEILAGKDWFTDGLANIGSKDFSMQLRGIWIAEFSEMDKLGRADVSDVKSELSKTFDHFRPPYGHRPIKPLRQTVFMGTTNRQDWLKDETGGRRFWPVKVRPVVGNMIDIDGLRRDRDQIWAETLQRYGEGATWWLEDAETIRDAEWEQAARFDADIWHDRIKDFIAGKESVSIVEVLLNCIHKTLADCDQCDKNRVAKCLIAAGWERKKVGPRDNRGWRYFPADE